MRVLAAMSGGVDSSVAAAILRKDGYQVIGATMQVWPSDTQAGGADRFGGCCGTSAIEDARRVANRLGITHYVLNLRGIFQERVINEFCHEYSLGRTPNPCISCNRYIKFGALLEKARELGADYVATGHYAGIEQDGTSGRYLLKKGAGNKDQSYVLYSLTQEQLRHILLPAGGLTKLEVREIAKELGLHVSARPESQEICFIPEGDYTRFLKEHIPDAAKPGLILDRGGNVLGRHRGVLYYTVGQRKRLGISAREPLYVTAIDPGRNTITVGLKAEVYSSGLSASRLNWIAIDELQQPLEVKARIRYRHHEAEAVITPEERGSVRVEFHEPQMAITPGQAVVFYRGDSVVGGGVIEQAIK